MIEVISESLLLKEQRKKNKSKYFWLLLFSGIWYISDIITVFFTTIPTLKL